MRVSEIFHSIQGEGTLAGTPSAFIRTSGCNLRCAWCDTDYTSWQPDGEEMGIADIVGRVSAFESRHVVVTGGEPMIFPEVTALTQELRRESFHVTVETAGTVYHDVACDLASVSPKLSNSTPHSREGGRFARQHDDLRINLPVIQRFMDAFDHQLKFVVDRAEDIEEVDTILGGLQGVEAHNVFLMPQGVASTELEARSRWLADICKERGFRFCPRLHIMLYGNTRGT